MVGAAGPGDYAWWINRVLLPAYEGLRGRDIQGRWRWLDQSQWWSPDRLAEWQRRELTTLLEHARARVPFYQRWLAQGGQEPRDLAQGQGWAELPLQERARLMDAPGDYQTQPLPAGSFAKATGGSTGRPLSFQVDPGSSQWRDAARNRGYGWAGCLPGVRQLYLWGVDILPKPTLARWKADLHNRLLRTRTINCFQLTDQVLDQTLESLSTWRPAVLGGYVAPLVALARRARETGWRPSGAPGAVICGAEALFPSQRQLIGQALGCPVFNTYGNREFMLIAAECPEEHHLHVSMENLLVEVLDPEGKPTPPGELGEVVVTDLHNLAQPFIRYRTGDLAEPLGRPCACGRGLMALKRVVGRELDMITAPDGRRLPGEYFPHFLKDFQAIESFQVVQTSREDLLINLVLRRDLTPEERRFLLDEVGRVLPGMRVELRPVDHIQPTPSGKRRITVGWGGD